MDEKRILQRKKSVHILVTIGLTIAVCSCTVGVVGFSLLLNILDAIGAK